MFCLFFSPRHINKWFEPSAKHMHIFRSIRQKNAQHGAGPIELASEPFRHEALEDSAEYIRLLEIVPPANSRSTPSFNISTWPIDGAPRYNAISYAWGRAALATILIDGQRMEVRHNCRDALAQAASFDSSTLLWVDSVCINQGNLSEKGQQVRRMFDIYKNAANVLSCIGNSDEDSRWLFAECRKHAAELKTSGIDGRLKVEFPELASRLTGRFSNLNPEERAVLQPLQHVYHEFGHREYWNRCWIRQEVLAGGEEVYVLCGDDAIPFSQLQDMDASLRWRHRSSELNGNPLKHLFYTLEYTNAKAGCIGSLVNMTLQTECRDPRDRIYSLLALVNWERNHIQPIDPDYSISPWQLAQRIILGMNSHKIQMILQALRIDASSPELSNLLAQRRLLKPSTEQPSEIHEWNLPGVAARLSVDEQGALSMTDAAVGASRADGRSLLQSLQWVHSPEYSWSNSINRKPQQVFIGNEFGALVCAEARSGDFLFSGRRAGAGNNCFVLRPSRRDGSLLDIVGSGILVGGVFPFWHGSDLPQMQDQKVPSCDSFGAAMILTASCEDIMVWETGWHGSQELSGQDGYRGDPPRELLHLMTRPIYAPEKAARLVPRTWTRIEGDWGPRPE